MTNFYPQGQSDHLEAAPRDLSSTQLAEPPFGVQQMTYPHISKSFKCPDTIFVPPVPISGLKARWFGATLLPWISFFIHQTFQVLFSPEMGQIISLSLITDPVPSHLLFVNSSINKTPPEEPNLSDVCCKGNSLPAESKVPPDTFLTKVQLWTYF